MRRWRANRQHDTKRDTTEMPTITAAEEMTPGKGIALINRQLHESVPSKRTPSNSDKSENWRSKPSPKRRQDRRRSDKRLEQTHLQWRDDKCDVDVREWIRRSKEQWCVRIPCHRVPSPYCAARRVMHSVRQILRILSCLGHRNWSIWDLWRI